MRTLPVLAALALLLVSGLTPGQTRHDLRCSVAPTGDLDGDGAPDFALALRPDDGNIPVEGEPLRGDLGTVVVLSGCTGRRIRRLARPSGAGADFGRTLVDAGDVDADGARDLAVAGLDRVWVLSGSSGATLLELAVQPPRSDWYGVSMAGGEDRDGDGTPDLALVVGEGEAVRAEVFSGRTGALVESVACALPEADESSGEDARRVVLPGGRLLYAVGLVPDIDGDRRAELVVGTQANPVGGEHPAHGLRLLHVLGKDPEEPIASTPLPYEPWLIEPCGDLDGDGTGELLVSMIEQAVAIVSGRTGDQLRWHDYTRGYLLEEGRSLAAAGDVDGDGVDDYLVAANEVYFDCDPGFLDVYSGADGARLHRLQPDYDLHGGQCGAGIDACPIGDVDGDGVTEIVAHLPRKREARVLSGATFEVLLTIDLAPGAPVLAGDDGSDR